MSLVITVGGVLSQDRKMMVRLTMLREDGTEVAGAVGDDIGDALRRLAREFPKGRIPAGFVFDGAQNQDDVPASRQACTCPAGTYDFPNAVHTDYCASNQDTSPPK